MKIENCFFFVFFCQRLCERVGSAMQLNRHYAGRVEGPPRGLSAGDGVG